MQIPIGLVGVGKIANTQHLPTILSNPKFRLVAAADPHHAVPGVRSFKTIEDMLARCEDIQAVAICTPPQIRHQIAHTALQAGKHVLLEKPPCATLNELDDLKALAREKRNTLFTAWHSRHAPGVSVARSWLHSRVPVDVKVAWKEDVRFWHPGQNWIWQPGGLGVFDSGINGLSILTHLMPCRFALKRAELFFPSNRQAPIAATLSFVTDHGAPIDAALDWNGLEPQTWDIHIRTDDGMTMRLSNGGSRLEINGGVVLDEEPAEYGSIYAKFAELIFEGTSDVDGRPLKHVADAFMLASRVDVAAFHET